MGAKLVSVSTMSASVDVIVASTLVIPNGNDDTGEIVEGSATGLAFVRELTESQHVIASNAPVIRRMKGGLTEDGGQMSDMRHMDFMRDTFRPSGARYADLPKSWERFHAGDYGATIDFGGVEVSTTHVMDSYAIAGAPKATYCGLPVRHRGCCVGTIELFTDTHDVEWDIVEGARWCARVSEHIARIAGVNPASTGGSTGAPVQPLPVAPKPPIVSQNHTSSRMGGAGAPAGGAEEGCSESERALRALRETVAVLGEPLDVDEALSAQQELVQVARAMLGKAEEVLGGMVRDQERQLRERLKKEAEGRGGERWASVVRRVARKR